MIEIHEERLKRIAETYDLPVVKPVCPFDQSNIRSRLKPLVRQLTQIDRFSREHIYHAHTFEKRM
jgi:tRNA 2-thiocytidine biosynthesis protein TtcA